jgi:hypothetical protein
MNEFSRMMEPSAQWLPRLRDGSYQVDWASCRVVVAKTHRFVAKVVPSQGLGESISRLPLDPVAAQSIIQQSAELAQLRPILAGMEFVSTVGAITSVANLGVSIAGFAIVLHKLKRIEGKLDVLLGEVQALKQAVHAARVELSALSMARILSAATSLDRALAADSVDERRDLARRARDLFQESAQYYLAVWQQAHGWNRFEIPVQTSLELQGRFVACAIGELQAQFLLGDLGAFRHAVRHAAAALRSELGIDPRRAFTERSDGACAAGPDTLALFQADLPAQVALLRAAASTTETTAQQLASFEVDAELPALLDRAPHEILRAARSAPGSDVYLLPAA